MSDSVSSKFYSAKKELESLRHIDTLVRDVYDMNNKQDNDSIKPELNMLQEDLIKSRKKIILRLRRMPFGLEYRFLFLRYIRGMTIDEIACKMLYDRRWIYKIQNRAIEKYIQNTEG